MAQLKIKSQLPFLEKGGYLDDCGPSSAAAAVAYASQYSLDPSAADGIAAAARVGRLDVNGRPDGVSLAFLVKVVKALGGKAKWAADWSEVVAAAQKGAAILINAQSPKAYPASALKVNAFAAKRAKIGRDYGHCIVAAYDQSLGWQLADPTQTGKGKEAQAALLTKEQVRAIAASKGDAPHKRVLIITAPQKKALPVFSSSTEEQKTPEPSLRQKVIGFIRRRNV